MSIPLNVNVTWRGLLQYKKERMLLFGLGIPFSILFNLWLYQSNMGGYAFTLQLWLAFLIFAISQFWAIPFGFIGGATAFDADLGDQIMMTFIAGYLLYFLSILIAPVLFLGLFITTGIGGGRFLFGFPISLTIGLFFGTVFNKQVVDMYFGNIKKEKEIEDKKLHFIFFT